MNNVLGDHPCEKGNVTIATILKKYFYVLLLFSPVPRGMKNKYIHKPIQKRNTEWKISLTFTTYNLNHNWNEILNFKTLKDTYWIILLLLLQFFKIIFLKYNENLRINERTNQRTIFSISFCHEETRDKNEDYINLFSNLFWNRSSAFIKETRWIVFVSGHSH